MRHALILIAVGIVLLIGCTISRTITFRSPNTGEVITQVDVPISMEDFNSCTILGMSQVGPMNTPTNVMVIFECEASQMRYGLVLQLDGTTVEGVVSFNMKTEIFTHYLVKDGKAKEVTKEEFQAYMAAKAKVVI